VQQYPSLTLQASGLLVGLPWGEMGNSEVGHLNIGAGRIVGQDLPRINNSIQNREFFSNPVLLQAFAHAKENNSRLHLMGLISPGGVHSSDQHLYALLGLAVEQGVSEVYIHMFTDGRDTPEKIALDSLQRLKDKIATIGVGTIASITGRFYAMDRGKHWEQTELTYQMLVAGKGASTYTAEDAVLNNYGQNIFDEMIPPTYMVVRDTISGNLRPVARISENDAVIFFNFRPDRMLQLTQAFVQPELMDIPEKHPPLKNLFFVTMTQVMFDGRVHVAFPPQDLKNNLAEVVANSGLTQFHIAESEKYTHVTSFFDGARTQPYPGEESLIIKSPNNAKNYSDHPEMSAAELNEALIERITNSPFNFFVANFANPDVVGHTGNLQAGIHAVQFLDRCLQQLIDACLSVDCALIITADHGNIEQMINLKTGDIDKDHTTNPVPCLIIANEFRFSKPKNRDYLSLSARTPEGIVSDIAPTVLDLFGLPKPPQMTGINLLDLLQRE
jgi:2,3-bisphosphoglycerate-independent phosphoglycerate mutase